MSKPHILESIRFSRLLQTCPSCCVSLGEPRLSEPRGPCLQHAWSRKISVPHLPDRSLICIHGSSEERYQITWLLSHVGAGSPGSRPFAASADPPTMTPGSSSHQRSCRSWCWWRWGRGWRKWPRPRSLSWAAHFGLHCWRGKPASLQMIRCPDETVCLSLQLLGTQIYGTISSGQWNTNNLKYSPLPRSLA